MNNKVNKGLFQKGHKINLGRKNRLGFKHSESSKLKMSKTFFKKGHKTWNKGLPWPKEMKERISQTNKRKGIEPKIKFKEFGEKHPRYNGGSQLSGRRQNLKRYGITLGDYEKMFIEQGGLCAICKQKNDKEKHLNIDHNHETGAVRGLLCRRCNTGLGAFKDSVLFLEEAIKYLNK